ncbi:MAG: zinc ribbon domain-containing protein [Lachnospiraceae bacterium]|nr:zinc ribbon domain-containing protein [Lachnospiraceae bacterium]MBO4670191.1 zinc ribbon domain-containing protein [Lachnospiraceae bacterium]MBR5667887.1 zinc ribbon domain-containing protein [Lachnospiraceae bacterium]
MDECKVCGRKNPLEDANFCYYCGASLKDGAAVSIEKPEAEKAEETPAADLTREKRPFTVKHWLGLFLCLLIPLYGWIAFIVIALISAFGANATDERRSFAKAFLLFIVIAVIVIALEMMYIQNHPELLAEYNKMIESMSK